MLEVKTVVSQCKEIAVLEDCLADYLGRYHGVLNLFTKFDDRKITLNRVLTEEFQYAEYSQWQVGVKVVQISLPFYLLQVENDMNERASEWCSAVPVPHPLDCLEKLETPSAAPPPVSLEEAAPLVYTHREQLGRREEGQAGRGRGAGGAVSRGGGATAVGKLSSRLGSLSVAGRKPVPAPAITANEESGKTQSEVSTMAWNFLAKLKGRGWQGEDVGGQGGEEGGLVEENSWARLRDQPGRPSDRCDSRATHQLPGGVLIGKVGQHA